MLARGKLDIFIFKEKMNSIYGVLRHSIYLRKGANEERKEGTRGKWT